MRVLRPGVTCKDKILEQSDNGREAKDVGNFVVNMGMLLHALQDFQRVHNSTLETCQEWLIGMSVTRKKGLTCSVMLTCRSTGCSLTKVYPLYKAAQESRRGPKRAAINKQFGHAVQDSSLGMHGACQLFASLDMSPLAHSNCQMLAKLVDKEMTEVNERDLNRLAGEKLIDNNQCGLSGGREGEVAISVDSRYNSTRFGNRKKMGLCATQAVTTAIDSCTGRVLDYIIENKVCSKGCRLRQHNNAAACAHERTQHDCSATLPIEENILEGPMNTKLGVSLLTRGLIPVTVTSDNDGQGAKPYQALLGARPERWTVMAQSDPSHLGNSQVRAIEKVNFRKETFSCARVKTIDSLKKLLAKDVKYRSSMIAQQSTKLALSILQVNHLASTAVECFGGNHQMCSRLVGSSCCGTEEDNWMLSSSLFRAAGLRHINCNEEEKKKLLDVFNIRLHANALQATKLGFSTQRNEAFNRALSKNMPKNVLFSKNYRGRASSAVYRHNNGHASVARKLADVGCPLSRNAIKRLQSQQKNIKRARALQISGQYKKMRAMSRMRAAQDWIKRKIAVENRDHEYICSKTTSRVAARLSRSVEHDYCKGQNDPFQPQ